MKSRRDKRILWLFAGLLVAYLPYMFTRERIANYPHWLYYSIFGLIAIVLLVTGTVKASLFTNNQKNSKHILVTLLRLAFSLLIAWFIAGLLLTPFNYYNIHVAKQNPLEQVDCEIDVVERKGKRRMRNRYIYYKLHGRFNMKHVSKAVINEIRTSSDDDNFVFAAEIRKGLLGSYYLERGEVKRK